MDQEAFLARAIHQGAGLEPADLVIKGCRLLNVATCEIDETDIAVTGDRITGTYGTYEGRDVVDGRGLTAVPGFIDSHLHVESSLVTPFEFERCVLPKGVTTAICDPHEIANVAGSDGIRYFLDCAMRMVMDLRIQLSSCVPATAFETAGAKLEVEDLLPLRAHPKVLGLAEFMNFPGVLAKEESALAKLAAFQGRPIDGHCPLLRGHELNGYLAAGIRTEHEATSADEALEKLRKGATVLIREGSVSKDLSALTPIIDERTSPFLAFCTDDRNPLDIAEEGHLDFIIRTAIAGGAPLPHVYRAASWSAANAFGLRDRGLIAPGRRADIVLLSDLEHCVVEQVVAGGQTVSHGIFTRREEVEPVARGSVRCEPLDADAFAIPAEGEETPVIGVVPGRIITEHLTMRLPTADGVVSPDPGQDAIKVAVVERHGRNGNIGRGFVHGFGLRRGAIASSVGHDSHNITVVGVDDADMACAVNRIIEMEGGFAVAGGGEVRAELPLPVAGLMSLEPFERVRDGLMALRAAARELGCTLPEPFLQVAFLPLPVIPHLKITDMGLFDVDRFSLVDASGADSTEASFR